MRKQVSRLVGLEHIDLTTFTRDLGKLVGFKHIDFGKLALYPKILIFDYF